MEKCTARGRQTHMQGRMDMHKRWRYGHTHRGGGKSTLNLWVAQTSRGSNRGNFSVAPKMNTKTGLNPNY